MKTISTESVPLVKSAGHGSMKARLASQLNVERGDNGGEGQGRGVGVGVGGWVQDKIGFTQA